MKQNAFLKFIYSEKATNFAKSSPYFWLALHRTKVRWRFRKILWPFQNIWTLTVYSIYCANFSDFHAMTCGHFWSLSCLGNGKTCKFVKFYLVSKLHCSHFSLGCALLCMCRNKFHEYFLLNLEIESQLILIAIIDSPKVQLF